MKPALSVDAAPLYWDPLSHELNRSPYNLYQRLRDEQPVYYNEKFGFYVLSRYEDVVQARRDYTTFSSSHSVQFERLLDPKMPLNFMNDMDPPEHSAVRMVVQREFTPKRVQELEAPTRALCADLLDRLRDKSEFDFVTEFAEPFPFLAICQFLGVEKEHHETLWSWWEEREAKLVAERDHPDLSGTTAVEERIGAYLRELAQARRAHPRNDMMSFLVQTEVADGDRGTRRLTQAEIGEYCRIFFVAGSATTTVMLAWAALLLHQNPAQRRRLIDDPSLIPNAIEEIMRLEPPAPSGGRWLLHPVTLHDTLIPKDSIVMLHTAAASRDDRVYEQPDIMDVSRKVRQLAFGYGVHMCIGAALAQLEGRIALQEMLQRFPDWTIDEDTAKMRISSGLRGWKSFRLSP
jgi:cytochrome P450